MLEGKKPCMQCLPRESLDNCLERFSKFVGFGLVGTAIFQIAYKRMTYVGHVHANLMRSAGFQFAFHKGSEGCRVIPCAEALLDLKMRDCMTGVIALLMDHGLFGAVTMGAAEGGINGSGCPVGSSPDDREVCAFQIACTPMVGKLRTQVAMGKIVLGHDHDSAGFLVEAMYDTRSLNPADPRQ